MPISKVINLKSERCVSPYLPAKKMVGQRRQTVSQLEVQLSHTGEKLYRQAVDFSAPNCFSAQSKSSRKQQSHFNTLIPPSLERCVLAKVCRARACFTLIEKEWKCLSTLCNTHFKLLASPYCVIKAINSQPALARNYSRKANIFGEQATCEEQNILNSSLQRCAEHLSR